MVEYVKPAEDSLLLYLGFVLNKMELVERIVPLDFKPLYEWMLTL